MSSFFTGLTLFIMGLVVIVLIRGLLNMAKAAAATPPTS